MIYSMSAEMSLAQIAFDIGQRVARLNIGTLSADFKSALQDFVDNRSATERRDALRKARYVLEGLLRALVKRELQEEHGEYSVGELLRLLHWNQVAVPEDVYKDMSEVNRQSNRGAIHVNVTDLAQELPDPSIKQVADTLLALLRVAEWFCKRTQVREIVEQAQCEEDLERKALLYKQAMDTDDFPASLAPLTETRKSQDTEIAIKRDLSKKGMLQKIEAFRAEVERKKRNSLEQQENLPQKIETFRTEVERKKRERGE